VAQKIRRRLEKLEQRQSVGRYTWRLANGREVSFNAIEMFAARMDLCERQYAAWVGEEMPPPSGALAALLDSSPEERARLAEGLPWLRYFDYEVERWQNPSAEMLEVAHEQLALEAEGLE